MALVYQRQLLLNFVEIHSVKANIPQIDLNKVVQLRWN